jgi:hypothetical protein
MHKITRIVAGQAKDWLAVLFNLVKLPLETPDLS